MCVCVSMHAARAGRAEADQERSTGKVTFDQSLGGSERVSQVEVWEKCQLSGRRNVKCKGPETGAGLVSSEQQGDHVAGAYRIKRGGAVKAHWCF